MPASWSWYARNFVHAVRIVILLYVMNVLFGGSEIADGEVTKGVLFTFAFINAFKFWFAYIADRARKEH